MSKTTEKPKPVDDLSDDELRSLLGDALLTVEDLTRRLDAQPPANDPTDFSNHAPPEMIGQTHTARDSAEVKQAMVSIDVAVREITTVETVTSLVTYIANRFGVAL